MSKLELTIVTETYWDITIIICTALNFSMHYTLTKGLVKIASFNKNVSNYTILLVTTNV